MSSVDDSEVWICFGEESGILLGDPNALKFLITPRVSTSKTYLPNNPESGMKKFDPQIPDISLHSLQQEVIPWLLNVMGLNEEFVAAVMDAFKEVIDEGFAYKLEKTHVPENHKDEEISMYETDLPRLIGSSSALFIRNAEQSPNDCDVRELSHFVCLKIILALYFDQPKVLPAGIPFGIPLNLEHLLSKHSFVGIVISLVKKLIESPGVKLSLLWRLVDTSVTCWENFPGKPTQLPNCIKEQLEKFIPHSTQPQNLGLFNNSLTIKHCGITVTEELVAPNYFSSMFPSIAYLSMKNNSSLSPCLEDKGILQDSTASICVPLSSSMPVAERRDLIDKLPQTKARSSPIISIFGSLSVEAEQYSIESCRNKKVLYILACIVRQVRPNGVKIGIAMGMINEKIKELMKTTSGKRTISVRRLLTGLTGDQSFLTPVCLVIVNGLVFLINFGPHIKLDFLRPSSIGSYMKFGLVAEQAFHHPL